MTLAVAYSEVSSFTTTTTPKTAAASWVAGDIVCVGGGTADGNATLNTPTVTNLTGTGLTFTLGPSIATGGTGECYAYIWWAKATGTGSGDISCGRSASAQAWGFGVAVISGGALRIRGVGFGNRTESATSLTTFAGSVVVFFSGDWSANVTNQTPSTGSGTPTERSDGGDGVTWGWNFITWEGTTLGSATYGFTSYAGLQIAQVGLEVLDTPTTPYLVADRGTLAVETSQTAAPVDMAAAGSITVGNYLIARIAANNTGAAGVTALTSISDPRSNSWTIRQATNDPGAADAGVTGAIAYCKVANAYTNGDDITVNFSPAVTSKGIVIEEWANIHATTPEAVSVVTTTTSGTAPSLTIVPLATGQLVYAALATEGPPADAASADADTTAGIWDSLTRVGTSNVTATANQTINGAYKVVTGTNSQTWNITITSRDYTGLIIVFAAASGSTQLVVADFTGSETFDNIALTQHHVLTVNDFTDSSTIDNVALTQHHVLAVNDMTSGTTWDAVTLTQHSALVVNDFTSGSTFDNVALTQHHTLVVADFAGPSTWDAVALTQHHVLIVNDFTSATTWDAISLTQHNVLTVADFTSASLFDTVALTQHHVLVVADFTGADTWDSVTLTQHHVLTIADFTGATTWDNVTLGVAGVLIVADFTSASLFDNISLTQHQILVVADFTSGSLFDAIVLLQHHVLIVADITSASLFDSVVLTQDYILGIADFTSASLFDQVTLTVQGALVVADFTSSSTFDNVGLIQHQILVVADFTSGTLFDSVTLTQIHVLTVFDLSGASLFDNLTLGQTHILTVEDMTVVSLFDTIIFVVAALTLLRIYCIQGESRTYGIDAEERTFCIAGENRTLIVEAP